MTRSIAGCVKLAAAAAMLAAFVTAPLSMAQAQERLRWQVPMAFPSSMAALGDTLPWVARRLAEASGDRIRLQVFEPGTLIPAQAIFEHVSQGRVPAGYSWMGYEWDRIPAAALFGAVPFGLEPPAFMAWMYFQGGKELLRELYEPHNVHPILCGAIGPEAAGWFRFELTSPEQLQGLRIRAAGLGGEVMAELGMSVTLLPGGEMYEALARGDLDAIEFSLPSIDEQLGFHQVADYFYMPGWHQPGSYLYLYVNLAAWRGLEPQAQALIETSCTAAVTMSLARAEALQGAALKRLEERGVKLVEFDDRFLQAFREATARVMARRSSQDPDFAKVHAAMSAFQQEHAPWKRLGYLPRDPETAGGE